jgi:hypothetical protein
MIKLSYVSTHFSQKQVIFTMPMSPLVVNKASGDWMWTAASVLALRTPSMQFDPATPSDTIDKNNYEGLSMMELYVQKLLSRSFEDTALFWHYAMRHVPSDSLLCASYVAESAANPIQNGAKLDFFLDPTLSQLDPNLLTIARNASIPMQGYSAFTLGGIIDQDCLCGWTKVAKICQIPAIICREAALFPNCSYPINTTQGWQTIQKILDAWKDDENLQWPCPSMDFSDSWGVVPGRHSDEWIAKSASSTPSSQRRYLNVSLSEVIRSGRAGLRIGNMRTIAADVGKVVKPSHRVHKLHSQDGNSTVALKRCAGNILKTFDANSFAKAVTDDLFPAAQGVSTESWAVSVCMRFSIEYSRLRVLKMLSTAFASIDSEKSASIQQQAAMQEGVVSIWKQKCESQLGMLAVCKSNSIFEMVPATPFQYECPFQITDDYKLGTYYVGPSSCLVFINSTKSFYDPCMHPTKECGGSGTLFSIPELLSNTASTKIKFDVRSLGKGEVLGTWPVKFYDSRDEEKNKKAAEYVKILEEFRTSGTSGVPWRLTEDFATRILGMQDTGDIGNTQRQKKWATAEGFASDSTEFCDGIADWWPEDWTKPVGYHVTVPCSKDDTGYRLFDAAFAIDRDDPSSNAVNVVTIKYVHTMLRDQEIYHSRFGTAGFCRSSNYGMPQYDANTMRVCTTDASNAKYDPAAPVKPKWAGNFSSTENCAPLSTDVPWSLDDNSRADPAMFTVGNAPMWGAETWITQNKYPNDNRVDDILNTNPGLRSVHDWQGQSCSSSPAEQQLICETNSDCVPLDSSYAMECLSGVCILSRTQTKTCYSHRDCLAQKKWCAGNGKCVDSIIQVLNLPSLCLSSRL